jgi:hypothetical protein
MIIRLNKDKPQSDNALFSRDKNQKYKCLYSYCGIYGHLGSECRKKLGKKVNNGRLVDATYHAFFPGVCFKFNK